MMDFFCLQESHAVWAFVTPPCSVICVRFHYLGSGEEHLHPVSVLDEVLHQLLTVSLPLALEWLWPEQVGESHRHRELV